MPSQRPDEISQAEPTEQRDSAVQIQEHRQSQPAACLRLLPSSNATARPNYAQVAAAASYTHGQNNCRLWLR
jgi:hypothetical protein